MSYQQLQQQLASINHKLNTKQLTREESRKLVFERELLFTDFMAHKHL